MSMCVCVCVCVVTCACACACACACVFCARACVHARVRVRVCARLCLRLRQSDAEEQPALALDLVRVRACPRVHWRSSGLGLIHGHALRNPPSLRHARIFPVPLSGATASTRPAPSTEQQTHWLPKTPAFGHRLDAECTLHRDR
eukprot:Tamp_25666.p2 GENE.Tamp_25666~~Tamp_25666.p2  ORF type:complete len:144 (-),score=4.82 Tamp_25666:233-664(-)